MFTISIHYKKIPKLFHLSFLPKNFLSFPILYYGKIENKTKEKKTRQRDNQNNFPLAIKRDMIKINFL